MHKVQAKAILSAHNGINVYRGCTHGCIYCDSRSKCYHIDHLFEDIEVKENAAELLEKALTKKRNKVMVGTGSMCDPYMPLENILQITSSCLKVILKHHCGVSIITKSDSILRDLDLLVQINEEAKCVVNITLTTFNDDLCKIIEPNVCVTSKRIQTLQILKEHHIPTIVWLCPFLPFINDQEENLMGLLNACKQTGVKGIIFFGIGLTLREGNREYFYEQLDKHFPFMKEKYQKMYGDSYMISSPNNTRLSKIFHQFCKENHIMDSVEEIFQYLSEYPKKYEQLSLF